MTTIAEERIVQVAAEPLVNNVATKRLPNQVDDGSSSGLSDPDDRTGNEDGHVAQGVEEDGSDIYDTEAETERLEETPRKQRNVLLTPSIATLADHSGVRADSERGEEVLIETRQQASDSSPEETVDEEKIPSTSLSSRKRKRSAIVSSHKETGDGERKKPTKVSKLSRSPSLKNSSSSPTPVAEDQSLIPVQTIQPALKQSFKRGKRKGKKVKEYDAFSKDEVLRPIESPQEVVDHGEPASSNEEDIEMEEIGEHDGVDLDNNTKTEEDLAKKKTAMDSLSAIEICFATYRDKIFDERLAQCNDELTMLEQPTFIHPELLLMKEVIDRRRNQKIQYEQTLLKLKLETLQRESIANKAQIHSQYMLVAGELRDTYLSQINAEIYQTQRERRNCEGDMPDFMYAFNSKRSKQIADQTAYNEEISLLSGLAKYVGFPAAPDIIQIRQNEWEEDQRAFQRNVATEDESSNARRVSQKHPPMLRASLSAASTFGRSQPAAEDKFLQQNAWANPQHPAHQKRRQVSVFSQATTPSVTPANQKHVGEVHGSASTILDHPSAPNSSLLPTPATEEVRRDAHPVVNHAGPQAMADATPSRITGDVPAWFAQSVEHSSIAPPSDAELGSVTFSSQTSGLESHAQGVLPKPLSFMQSGEIGRASPPVRNAVIKAEDPGNNYGRSAIDEHDRASPLVSNVSNN